jgi:hypothetical protein
MLSNHTKRSFGVESAVTKTKAGSDMRQTIFTENIHCDILKYLDNHQGSGHTQVKTGHRLQPIQVLPLPLVSSF